MGSTTLHYASCRIKVAAAILKLDVRKDLSLPCNWAPTPCTARSYNGYTVLPSDERFLACALASAARSLCEHTPFPVTAVRPAPYFAMTMRQLGRMCRVAVLIRSYLPAGAGNRKNIFPLSVALRLAGRADACSPGRHASLRQANAFEKNANPHDAIVACPTSCSWLVSFHPHSHNCV